MTEKHVDTVNVDAKIAEYEAMIEKLKAEKVKLEAQKNHVEYPKMIQVPVAPYVDRPRTQTVTVNSAEEERAALAGAQKSGETDAQYEARLKAEAAAKAAKAKAEADKK